MTAESKVSDINGNHKFSFDRVFGSEASQKDVFQEVAVPSVDGVFNGYNGTIFAYGQTGSGKSFTMEGASLYDEKLKGLIPRMFEYLFSKIGAADPKVEFTIKCSYLEIYMERICDLLDGKQTLTLILQPRSKTCKSRKTKREVFTFKTLLKCTFLVRRRCMRSCGGAKLIDRWPQHV